MARPGNPVIISFSGHPVICHVLVVALPRAGLPVPEPAVAGAAVPHDGAARAAHVRRKVQGCRRDGSPEEKEAGARSSKPVFFVHKK